jgi:hypothetical protein
VKGNLPEAVGVPATIVPAAPYDAGIVMPGGTVPETIENVPPELVLVRMNPSYG